MPRPEKVQAVAEIKNRLDEAQAVFLAEYAGLSVKEQQNLRRELRANEAEFKVVKMTLARRAAAELDIDSLDELLLGPTGLAFADGDPVGAARALRDFAKSHEVFLVKGGLLGREFLSAERVGQLADMEPRDVLLAKIAGAFQAPLAKAAGLLAALPRNTASAIQQLIEKLEQVAPSEPAPEAAAEADDAVPEADVDAEAPTDDVESVDAETSDAETPEAESADAETAKDAATDDESVEVAATEPSEIEATERSAEVESSVDSQDTESADDEATPTGADEEE
jgi:large subunit ribosomal protein L10